MKEVINSIVKDITNCTSEEKKLTMAATAFGTMGEDANLKVVQSLTTLGDNFNDVQGSMQKIKDTRYDDIRSSIQTLGKKFITSLAEPIKKRVLPALNNIIKDIDFDAFAKKTTNAINKVISVFKWFIQNKSIFIGVINGMLAAFAITKIATFASTFGTVIKAFMSAPTIIAGVTSAMKALNLTTVANPYVALATAISAITIGLTSWAFASDETYQKFKNV